MALTLGLKIGDVVDVADRWIALLSIDNSNSATLISNGGHKITVFSDQMTQLSADVRISLGRDPATYRLRLVFDAPRYIPITRRHD